MAGDRAPWTVLGRIIGTATGWDQVDTFVMTLYDFVPVTGASLPSGDLSFDFENGTAESFDEEGNPMECVDLVQSIAGLNIHPVYP